MKKSLSSLIIVLTVTSLLISGCIDKSYNCTDPLGCLPLSAGAPIQIAGLLTLSGPDADIDATRGIEIAVADKVNLLNHPIELIEQDDLCNENGGRDGATRLAAISQIVGVIGASCSSASVPAAKILSDKGMLLISPSSTAPSLTDPATHQAGFLRSIYNDDAQGKAVAEFAFNVLGARRMVTVHDGTPYPKELQAAACTSFEQLGGQCVKQIEIRSGDDLTVNIQTIIAQKPDALYYPVYNVDGVALTHGIAAAISSNIALISSDGLLTSDFIKQTEPVSEGMYLSGPANLQEPKDFLAKYKTRYGQDPTGSYHLQSYDAAMMLFAAIEKVAINSGGTLYIPRKALRDALYATRGMHGLSGVLTCSTAGDCARPNIEIFQIVNSQFKAIYP